MPVMNPWGKKNTGKGKHAGCPSLSQPRMKITLTKQTQIVCKNETYNAHRSGGKVSRAQGVGGISGFCGVLVKRPYRHMELANGANDSAF